MKKSLVWRDICNSVALIVYTATRFSSQSKFIYRRKIKEDKNFMMWMLELLTDVGKFVLVMNIEKALLLLEYTGIYAFK